MERDIIPMRLYRHFKGRLYYVHSVGKHSETEEVMVTYQALYPPYDFYIRPLEMFASKVDLNKYPDAKQEYRFELYK